MDNEVCLLQHHVIIYYTEQLKQLCSDFRRKSANLTVLQWLIDNQKYSETHFNATRYRR